MLNSGDIGFMIIAATYVFLMTPGLAFFYGGLAQRKNVLNTMMMSVAFMGLSSVLWVLCGYSLSFSGDLGGVIGNLKWFAFNGVGAEAGPYSDNIPNMGFALFQMMFAIITPSLITGAVAGRMKFKAIFLFVFLWQFVVYYPMAHMVWGGGFLAQIGSIDFAGGNVVHISSGVSGLVLAILIGKRKGIEKMSMNNNVNIDKKETADSAEKIDKIVICDDDKDIVRALQIYLSNRNYELLCAYTGREALDFVKKGDVSLVLLDIMMPEMDGITALRAIREKSNVPVILITAKSEDADKVLGLDVGADDYITKPFNPIEVLARVRSQLRRYNKLGGSEDSNKKEVLSCGGVTLDDRTKQVTMDGEEVSLTPTEYEILKFLMSHPKQVFSPRQIYSEVWKDTPIGSEGTVAVHIRHLREKLEIEPSDPRHFKVVWGQGYKFE